MKFLRLLLIFGLAAGRQAWAVYAPIPDQDQGKAWAFSVAADVVHDSNIFGGATGSISSTVYSLVPKIAFNASVTDQTFLSASYQLNLDHFDSRPGDKTLDSHLFTARLAHAFTQATTLDLSDSYAIEKNPESLLNGLAVNTDQSFKNNEIDASFGTNLGPKTGLTLKARSVLFRYDNARLGASLDRTENLYGVSGDYAVLPELKAVGEYRREDIDYRELGATKDKKSDFLLAGADYNVAKKVTASGRLGVEWRHRQGERSKTSPYAELSTKFDYAPGSFLTAGYVYTLEETSNPLLYTDTQVNRFFVNAQHALTGLVTLSGSVDYEPSKLMGRRGIADVDETTNRYGLALSYLPTKNWTISLNDDYDKISSGDATRELSRNRTGLSARYSF